MGFTYFVLKTDKRCYDNMPVWWFKNRLVGVGCIRGQISDGAVKDAS